MKARSFDLHEILWGDRAIPEYTASARGDNRDRNLYFYSPIPQERGSPTASTSGAKSTGTWSRNRELEINLLEQVQQPLFARTGIVQFFRIKSWSSGLYQILRNPISLLPSIIRYPSRDLES